MFRKVLFVLLVVCLFLASLAVSACNPPRPKRPLVSYFDHEVRYKGETLALIASWYTGDSNNWNYIMDHNLGLDFRRLQIGTLVRIPEDLMIRHDDLPRKLVYKSQDEKPMQPAPMEVVTEKPGTQMAPVQPVVSSINSGQTEKGSEVTKVSRSSTEEKAKSRDELLSELLAEEKKSDPGAANPSPPISN